jgi:exopolysaccharide biosynthesis protein
MAPGRASIALAALSVALAGPSAGRAEDRWTQVTSGLSVLSRAARWADGAPVRLFAARVALCGHGLALRVSSPGEGRVTVSSFARTLGAWAAINGDYFNRRTLRPLGPSRVAGRWWSTGAWTHHDSVIALRPDGSVLLRDVAAPGEDALRSLVASGELAGASLLSARERVLSGGALRLSPWVEHDGRRHPRTGLGLSADGRTAWLVVIDGRSRASAGATVSELGEALRSLGASDGVKLDGGGSSALFVRGRGVLNRPSDGSERIVANHLAVVQSPVVTPCGSRALPTGP